jgi:hypothetical protein
MVTILSFLRASERERVSVEAIVGRAERLLDYFQAAGLVEHAP